MEIKTKYDIGQTVYVIDNYKRKINIIPCIIRGVQTYTEDEHTNISYYCNAEGILFWSGENGTFATKEEAEQKLKEIGNVKN